MSDLTLQLSQLDIEPIEVVSTPVAPDLDLEKLLSVSPEQDTVPLILDANISCPGAGCFCCCKASCNA